MATIKTLVAALLFGSKQPTFQTICSNYTEPGITSFRYASKPFRRAAAKLLHPYQCLNALDLSADDRLLVATWPTYANETCVHLSGFTYALPACAHELSKKHGVFSSIDGFCGGQPREIEGFMPEEYLSHSIAGARITISMPGAEENWPTGVTGKYGHFETFAKHRLPLGNQSIAISTDGCPKNDFFQPTPRHSHALVLPPQGVTIVSDVDDVLRECEVWNLKQMVHNTFVRRFQPWLDKQSTKTTSALAERASRVEVRIHGHPLGSMPQVYNNWSMLSASSSIHFHYVTEAPEMSHTFYIAGINQNFPSGNSTSGQWS